MAREDFVIVNGPIVTLFEPDWLREVRYSSGIVYSIQLTSGLTVTSPESFPEGADLPSAAEPTAQ